MRQIYLIVFLTMIVSGSISQSQAHIPVVSFTAYSVAVTACKPTLVRHGCGWDYPCPPRPNYGRRHYQFNYASRNGQVNINKNYGTVNVYVNGRRHHHHHHRHRPHPIYRPHHDGCTSYGCGRAHWKRVERRDTYVRVYPEDRAERSCGGYRCDRDCGTWCWYRRFKTGYCGHGCDIYRQKVRFETEERTIRVPRPVFAEAPRRYEEDYRREERDRIVYDEPGPRRRYYGPPYPP